MADVTPSKQHQVYEHVRGRLIDGDYRAGRRMNVAELSRELGVSNIPVREALRRLEAEGWLRYEPNAGMRVAERDPQAWIDVMTPFAVLAGYATAEAAPALRASGGVDELDALNEHMREAMRTDGFTTYRGLNHDFHQRIFDHTPNPELRRQLTETWRQLHVARATLYGAIPLRAFTSLEEHDALIALIADGADSLEIESEARAHTLRTVAASRHASSLASQVEA